MSHPLENFKYEKGILAADGVSLEEIARKVGTPAYIYSASGFLRSFRELSSGLRSVDHLICYAVKSNSNLAIIKMLADEGAGTDLVSGGELFRAGKAGVPGDRVVFSGVGKSIEEMEQALSYDNGRGIYSFNVESTPELLQLNEVAIRMKKVAPVALRFNPDVNAKTHPYISTGLKKNKFGVRRSEVLEIARRARELRGIEIRGISVHIGSQLLSLNPLNEAFGHAKKLLADLNAILPEPIQFVDLGGGLGITYKNEKSPALAAYCKIVLKHFGPKSGFSGKLLLEPGRILSGNSGVLLTRALFRKERKEKDFLILDAGMNDLMRPALYGSHHEIIPVRKPLRPRAKKTDIVGPVCETGDCFASNRMVPTSVEPGDLMAILSSGAYGFTMASNYNSRPRPVEVLAQDGNFRVIRQRENYDDLVRGESM